VPTLLRSAAALLALALPSAVALGQSAPAERVDEYRVKAAILYNLARFVTWPSAAFANPGAPFVICVLGTDPFGSQLEDVVRGHQIGERGVVTTRISEAKSGCHVLFISNSERRRLPSIIEQLRGKGSLTVGEADDFTKLGGMVGLSTRGEQVRFDINVAATTAERLQVSARLMSLASGARRAGESGP
jgi:hypothetical protein